MTVLLTRQPVETANNQCPDESRAEFLNARDIRKLGSGRAAALVFWCAVIGISLLWGTMGIATQLAFREGVAPYTLTTLRMTLASGVLVVYLAATRSRVHITRHLLRDGLVMAMGQVVLPSILFAAALERLSAGVVSLLFALVPAATALWMWISDPAIGLGRRAVLGLTMALGGAVLVSLNSADQSADGSRSLLGIGFILAAVLVSSFHGVYAKSHSSHSLFEVTAPQILIGTLVLLGPGILGGAVDWRGLSPVTWGVAAYLAAGVTLVPTIVLWWLFTRSSALEVALVNYLFPVVAVLVGVLWFGERFSGGLALGGTALLLGVAVVESGARVRHIHRAVLRPCPDFGLQRVERQRH